MEPANFSGEYYLVFLTAKGNSMQMERILTIFSSTDLSKNQFQGKILKVVRNLNSLKDLNVSHNNLTGGIPSSFGKFDSSRIIRFLGKFDLSFGVKAFLQSARGSYTSRALV